MNSTEQMSAAEIKMAIAARTIKIKQLSEGCGVANNWQAIARHHEAINEMRALLGSVR